MMQPTAPMPEGNLKSSIELITLFRDGDQDALNELLERYLPRLQRWAHNQMPFGRRTMEESADFVHDAVLSALKHLGSMEIRRQGSVWAYLCQAVKNRIYDHYRRMFRLPERKELAIEPAADGPSPLELAIGAEAFQRYRDALSSLKDRDRQLVVLRLELELGYDEIAAELGMPSPTAVRMAVTRAVARLADKMSTST